MKYNFDEVIDRSHTDCVKYEIIRKTLQRDDLLPLWVADMDFLTPPFVLDAIRKRLDQAILGYTCAPTTYYESICNWVDHRYGMKVKGEAIHYIPGIVPGISFTINAFTEKGDRIMIQPPVYHPFRHVIEACERVCEVNPLKEVNGNYEMDFDTLEQTLPGCKLFILCHPHNPGGVVWKRGDLERLATLCEKNGVTVISDEIHADMTFSPHIHTPFAMINETAKRITITFMAPSKAFNLPGVVASHVIIFNDQVRNYFFKYLDDNDLAMGNIFAFDCVQACYSDDGTEWLNEMLSYVGKNITFLVDFLKTNCPKIKAICPKASFLVFLDNRELPLTSQKELVNFYINEAHLFLNDGSIFGEQGNGFMRLNVATPRTVLEKALSQLKAAYDKAGY